ncbi:MAG: hypothetical protein VYE15_04155 [Myxococcota bacterium]|nr:hypothetical protein [Myxococcota bacterium]
MSPRGRHRRRGGAERAPRRLGSTLMKLGLYCLTLVMLLAFWGRLSDGAAGCYSQVSNQGQQGLTADDLAAPESTEEERPPGVVPVRLKLAPAVVTEPED